MTQMDSHKLRSFTSKNTEMQLAPIMIKPILKNLRLEDQMELEENHWPPQK